MIERIESKEYIKRLRGKLKEAYPDGKFPKDVRSRFNTRLWEITHLPKGVLMTSDYLDRDLRGILYVQNAEILSVINASKRLGSVSKFGAEGNELRDEGLLSGPHKRS